MKRNNYLTKAPRPKPVIDEITVNATLFKRLLERAADLTRLVGQMPDHSDGLGCTCETCTAYCKLRDVIEDVQKSLGGDKR